MRTNDVENPKSKVNFKATDKEIIDSGIFSKLKTDSNQPAIIKTGVNFLQDLIILMLREKKESGNIYVIYPTQEECETNATVIKGRYPDTIMMYSDEKKSDAFRPEFIQAAKDLQHSAPNNIILTTYATLDENIPVFSDSDGSAYTIRKNAKLDVSEFTSFLTNSGYCKVPFIQDSGDFCAFGEVIDVFPIFSSNPIRIYLDFDDIDKICYYNLKDDENLSEMEKYSFASMDTHNDITAPFTSLLRENDSLVFVRMEKMLELRNKAIRLNEGNAFETWLENHKKSIACEFYDVIDDAGAKTIPGVREAEAYPSFKIFKEKAEELLKFNYKVRIFTSSIIQRERIKSLLGISNDASILFEESDITSGFYLEDRKIAVFSANDIFNKKERSKVFSSLQTQPITDFTSLKPNDYVVHIDRGIGKFIGFDKIEMLGRIRDYIKIEYADKEFFYVPLERADQIEKYIGSEKIRLDKLHSNSWSRKKKKAMENARLFADNLLKLNARRKMQKGFCHHKDTDLQLIFEESFEKEETPDQLKAIEDIKKDMESNIPMDRIVCGDVGFGKTEVAFRACFKAIMSNKQVCFVSPTTILTSQHYNNFKKRCEMLSLESGEVSGDGLIKIEELSRIKSKAEAKKIVDSLKDGTTDIVFATHRVLQKDIGFKNLGLLVIDEEQRFGVKDKEAIKELKANVDTLTLTATPIPRTLYMSLVNLKDVSLLTTPPKQRVATDIVIRKYDEAIVIEAISNELKRGGQVFFLHNNTMDIGKVKIKLSKFFPNAKIDFIHGKMQNAEIENSIYNFANGWTDVLVSTTIIENGIDVPNANTLIVDDATIYGTSQLYQIKGRVGRSSRQAIAYLLYPENKSMNPNAIARLKVISENKSLGSGFNIAMGDLALRGAGNILSKEQSGHIAEVGLDTYMHLLDLCIKQLELKEKEVAEEEDFTVFINIPYTAYVPDEYIRESEVKFRLYKQLAKAKSEEEISAILAKIETRYGTLPAPIYELYRINLIKILCKQRRISRIDESADAKTLTLTFDKVKDMNFKSIMSLVSQMRGRAVLNNSSPNVVMLNRKKDDDRLEFLIDVLRKI